MDTSLISPLSTYKTSLKDAQQKNAETFFDDLVKKSKLNVEENRKTVKLYKEYYTKAQMSASKVRALKTWRVLLIILAAICGVVAVTFLALGIAKVVSLLVGLIVFAACGIVTAVSIIIIVKVIVKKLRSQEQILADLNKKAAEQLAIAKAQMEPLNRLFDWNMQTKIFSTTAPLVQMDQYFDVKKLDFLMNRFSYDEVRGDNSSIYYVQSGSMNGNPFVIERDLNQREGQKTYYGSRTITYTVVVRDSKGNSHVETRSQVLQASVVKPIPVYNYTTYLFYGNEAAPDLNFSRKASNMINKTDKQMEKIAKKGGNKVKKLSQRAVTEDKDGSVFTAMGNTDFEALFNALDRDNEVQFRLLFTPLAQQGEMDLIMHGPYGDDFSFRKTKKLNCIRAAHYEGQDIYGNPSRFYDYDVDNCKKTFVDYNVEYFKSTFFTMAPLLAIPVYEQTAPMEYIYKDVFNSNYTTSEEETMANSFGNGVFDPEGAKTLTILKAKFSKKVKDFDEVEVTGHSFSTTRMVDSIMVTAANGRTYPVDVFWDRYDPIQKVSYMNVKRIGASKIDYEDKVSVGKSGGWIASQAAGDVSYQRGLMAYVPKSRITEKNADLFDSYLGDEFVSKSVADKMKEMDKLVEDTVKKS